MYADWAPDGAALAVTRDLGNHRRLEYPVGTLLYETQHNLFNPRVSPDGKRVALWEQSARSVRLIVVDAQGTVRTVSPDWVDWWYLAWSPDGREIWFGASKSGGFNSTVYAVDLEGHRRTLYAGPGDYDVHDVLADGRALLGSVKQRARTVGLLDGWGQARDLSWFDGTMVIDIAVDGKSLLVAEWSEAGGPDESVYLQKNDGAPPVRLGDGRALALSPDGRLALAARARMELVLLPIGAGVEKPLASGVFESVGEARWLPDGKRFAVQASLPGQRTQLFLIDVGGGAPVALADADYGDTSLIAVSPDGARIAAVTVDERVALVPVAGGAPVFDDAFRPGDQPIAWSADGAALYVYRREAPVATVERVDLRTRRREIWKELPASDSAGVSSIERVVMTSDARFHAWAWQQHLTDLYLVEGLR